MRERRYRSSVPGMVGLLLRALLLVPLVLPLRHLDGTWPGTAAALSGLGVEILAFWKASWPWYPLALLALAGCWLMARRDRPRGGSPAVLALRLGLAAVSAAGLLTAVPRLASLAEQVVATPLLAPPADETAFRDTLLAELGRALTVTSLDAEIRAALARDDPAHARALVQAAGLLGRPLAPETQRAFAEADSWRATLARDGWAALQGAVTGQSSSLPGFLGALAGDLTPYGDLRDITWQLGFAAEPDELILGLSVVGLGLTATGLVLPAQAVPLQAGKAALKTSVRFARVGSGVAADLRRVVTTTVDLPAFRAAAREGRVTPELAARFVRRQGLDELRTVGSDLLAIGEAAGAETALAVLRHADGLAELSFYKRIATSFGDGAQAVVGILGKNVKRGFRVYRVTAELRDRLAAMGALLLSSLTGLLASLSTGLARRLAARWLRTRTAAG